MPAGATGAVSRRHFLGCSAALGAEILAGRCTAAASAQSDANQGPWQIGCWTRPWMNYEYRVALDAIAEAGIKFVGLMNATRPGEKHGGWRPENMIISYRDPIDKTVPVLEEATRRGLKVLFYYGGLMGAKNRKSAVADFRHVIEICAALKCENVLMGGLAETRGQEYENYLAAVAECCDYAAANRVHMTIKPHGGLGATGPQLRQAVEKINHKSFRILYDAGNVLFYSDGKVDPVADARALKGLVTGWCIKDYAPPGGHNALAEKRRGTVDFTPGTGQVDFRAVFAELISGGFTRGPLMIETLSGSDRPRLLQEAKKAREFVEGLTHSARKP